MKEGWKWHPWREEVRDVFWAEFEKLTGVKVGSEAYEKIMAARVVGVSLHHGYGWDHEAKKEIIEPHMG